jgi:hypothetical protein
MSDEVGFTDHGKIAIPEKGDIATEKIIADVNKKIAKETIEAGIRQETGTAPEKKGNLTKDVPQMVFRIAASVIGCKKFELDDDEASTIAANLNILIPIEGKIAALVVILMITLNKVYICLDAIKLKFGTKPIDEPPTKEKLPEQLK